VSDSSQPREEQEGVAADDLTDELARKYDPERLLKMFGKRAGKQEQLDASVRGRYEKRLGVDLGHVRVITGEFAEEFNKRRNSYAVTIGGTGMILMGGSPDRAMTSAAGRALLGHELTHVAQAKKGMYKASRVDSMPFAEEGHEAEAEAEAEEAALLAEEAGGGGYGESQSISAGQELAEQMDAEAKAKESKKKIVERVFELVAEAVRIAELRGGIDPRRP
jgi:hypothetical protein